MNAYIRSLSVLLLTAYLVVSSNETLAQVEAELVAEGIINTDGDQYGPTLTPDGNTLFFTERLVRGQSEQIMVSLRMGGTWSQPSVASFSGDGYDKEPYVSPDGSKLFFASDRIVDGKDRDFDIWVVEREGTDWGEPQHLSDVSSSAYDNYPAVAANGNLYFSSTRDTRDIENNDLYVARFENGHYLKPASLPTLNSPNSDADPYIDPDERFMIFSSTRPGGHGAGDLFISYNRDGKWSEPANLGPKVNTDVYEYTPFISPDGEHLYFSRSWGSIYRIDWGLLTSK